MIIEEGILRDKRKRRKHGFTEINGKIINPLTEREFQIGDHYNGMVFRGYLTRILTDGSISYRYRMMSEHAWMKRTQHSGRHKDNPLLVNNIVSRLISGAKKRSKDKGEILDINRESISRAVHLGWCQETYPPLPLVLDKPGSAFSPSIDRIDSNKSYTDENIRVACIQANMARNHFSDQDTIQTCQRLAEFLIRKRDKRSNSI